MARGKGPEVGTDGRVQVELSSSVELLVSPCRFGFGGPPMMPPSRYRNRSPSGSNSDAMDLLVLGAMALRSR